MKQTFFSILLTILTGLLFNACHTRTPNDPLAESPAATRYAQLLQMEDLSDGMTLCRILNPWQPERVAMQYLLIPEADSLISDSRLDEIEERYGRLQTLFIPLRQQTLTAGCYADLYDQLGALDYIGVLCDAEYTMNANVKQRLASGQIVEGGGSMAPNPEVILSAHSQAIWLTPYEAGSQAMISSILPNLPVIYCADYQETSPLGRAEWMRFFGRLVNKGKEADALFQTIEKKYNSIASITDSSQSDSSQTAPRPTLLPELPYGSTWYVPGGRSTMSWLYQDAGFAYPWADDAHGGSLSLSMEAVFDRAQQADVWIIKYYAPEGDWTLPSLLDQHPLYRQFSAAQSGRVYGCNTATSPYFEVAPFRPDLILTEMRQICQGREDSLRYFVRLSDQSQSTDN